MDRVNSVQELIERTQGGAGPRRSRLTEEGKKLLTLYDGCAAALRERAEELYEAYQHSRKTG